MKNKTSSNIPTVGSEAWKKAIEKALAVPSFSITLSEKCKTLEPPVDIAAQEFQFKYQRAAAKVEYNKARKLNAIKAFLIAVVE